MGVGSTRWTGVSNSLTLDIADSEAGAEYKESLATALGLPPPKGEYDFLGIVAKDTSSMVFCSEVSASGASGIDWSMDCEAGGEYNGSLATVLGLPLPNGE